MPTDVVNQRTKLARFSELWSPRVVSELNHDQIKLAKFAGTFVWHAHDDTGEADDDRRAVNDLWV